MIPSATESSAGSRSAVRLPATISREWAWSDATGAGVRVAVIDSGVEEGHPAVGHVQGWAQFEFDPEHSRQVRMAFDAHEDLVGHGTAAAGIIRAIAPECSLYSIRVLGKNLRTRGLVFAEGLRWAIENQMDVINMSLSSSSADYYALFHELADLAYFRSIMLVCAMNNADVPSYPSEYAAVISVSANEGVDPFDYIYSSSPPAEFRAPGLNLEVAWRGGGMLRSSGNSFAAPHMTGLIVRLLSKHPGLTPFQVKTVLQALASKPNNPPDEDEAADA